MELEHQIVVVLGMVIAFALVSRRLTRRWLTMPMVFVGLGLLGGTAGLGWITLDLELGVIHAMAEATLVIVLFGDASRIRLSLLRREAGLPVRLLAIGMPLTILVGTVLARVSFPAWTLWEAALAGAILAPTDAALGLAVISNPAVPVGVRQALNVESGLNDGIALPIVLLFIALGADTGGSAAHWAGFWAMQIVLGPALGGLIGGVAGLLLARAQQAQWSERSFTAIGGLSTAALCYVAADASGGNGYMAAFVGGLAFGGTSGHAAGGIHRLIEEEGELLMMLVFLLLGCALAGPALATATPAMFVYAGLSLTVVRMLPVALALFGAESSRATVVFLGWFGPRGLASLLFGMLLLEESAIVHGDQVFQVVVITVLASVFLHGVSAAWAAEAYGARVPTDAPERKPVPAHPFRRSIRYE